MYVPISIVDNMQKDLENVNKRCGENKMKINENKKKLHVDWHKTNTTQINFRLIY